MWIILDLICFMKIIFLKIIFQIFSFLFTIKKIC